MEDKTYEKEYAKKLYEKPTIIKEETMNFPLEIIATATGEKILCRQCSSYHGCR